MTLALQTHGLTRHFDDVCAVDHVDLRVESGTCYGFLGPNGAGKTTLLNMLTLEEKVKMVPGLLPMLIEGQDFIDAQDELSVLEFMRKYGMPERINDEIFIAMGALPWHGTKRQH